MSPGENPTVEPPEELSHPSEGRASVKSAGEILSPSRDLVSGGNAITSDLISAQPLPAAALPVDVYKGASGSEAPQSSVQKPTCPRCGLTVPDAGPLPPPPGPSPSRLQGSSSSVLSNNSTRGRSSGAAAETLEDWCCRLLLACLSCQLSALLLGLLEAASSCLHAACACCCHACASCCAAVRETPVEELNCHAHCHAVMFESCCEPTECLEFCIECCEICHRS